MENRKRKASFHQAKQVDKKGVVSEETVVLGQWGSGVKKNGVDNVNLPPYRDSES